MYTLLRNSHYPFTRSAMKSQDAQKSGAYSVPSAQTARAMAKAITYSSANSQTRSLKPSGDSKSGTSTYKLPNH
jgi:hypothetical protein